MQEEKLSTTFKWQVSNCRRKILSPTFALVQNKSIKCHLILKPCSKCNGIATGLEHYVFDEENCQQKSTQTHVSLELHFDNFNFTLSSLLPQLKVKFSILNSKSEKIIARTIRVLLPGPWFSFGLNHFISLPEFERLLNLEMNTKMTIMCKIKEISDIKKDEISSIETEILKGYRFFLGNEKFSDVTLFVGERKLRAHKVVLASRSPMFEKMFSYEMKENLSNEVEINFDYEIIWEVLRYIYTGKVENLDKFGIDVFKAANFYQLDNLKLICKKFIKANLKVENVIDVLKLADDFDLESLKNHCHSFYVRNSRAVEKTDAFKALRKSHPHLVLLLDEGCKTFL